MLTYVEHMKRIIHLAEQSLVHSQAERFQTSAEELMKISVHCTEAMKQLDEMSLTKYHGTDPNKNLSGGP